MMGRSQPESAPEQLKACLECQKRKSRCTGESPCAFCHKAKRSCVYTPRPQRTPLTRKNLDAAEQKCQKLASMLKSLNPDVDIESLLKDSETSINSQLTSLSNAGASPPAPTGSSSKYEWHEDPPLADEDEIQSPRDGMALLPTDPSDSGYLGSTAGSSMLQTILSLLSLNGHQPLDGPSNDGHSNLVATRQRSSSGPLSLEGELASSATTDKLIDAYFSLYNTSYPVLHSRLFRHAYAKKSQISSTSPWHMILYTVLAIGHWVLSPGGDHEDSPYYLAARSRMSAEMLESGTLEGVQAFLLMGNYLQKRDRPNTGYNMIGIAFRMALGLGLHREIPSNEGVEYTLSKEIRRRVWWILYMFDSGFSITMGRPTTASDAFIDVQLPLNIDDTNFTANDLALSLPQPVGYPTTYSAMIAQAQLAIIANKIYNEFLTAHISNPLDNEDLVCKFDEELSHWRNALPSYFASQEVPGWFQGPRAVILWKEQNLRMMLWLGGQRSNGIRPRSGDAIRNCALVALESVQAISEFCTEQEKLHQGLSWYATYFLFQAVLMLDVCLLQASNDSQTSLWRNATDQGRQCLSELGTTNPTALRCISILDRINKHYPSISSSQSWQTSQYHGSNLFQDLSEPCFQGVETDPSVQQPYSDDPAFHLFLVGRHGQPMANFFDGVHEFSSLQEPQNFDYVTGDFYNMNNFDMSMN